MGDIIDKETPFAITDFRGGLSMEANRGPRGAFLYGYGLNIRNGDNTLKCNQALKKDSSTTVVDLPLVGFRASDGKEYAFGDTGKIYRKSSGTWAVVYTESGGKITGAAEFTHNDGAGNYVPYLVWATQTKVRQTKLSDTTFASTADVGTFSVGSASYPHTMRMAAGSLMICDSHFLAELDFEGAFNPEALEIIPGNASKSLSERNDLVVIGSAGVGVPEGWVWTWDGGVAADSWILKRPAQGDSVNAMLPLEGGMLMQVGALGHLRFWNYAEVSPLTQVMNSKWAYPGGICEYNTVPHIGMNGGTLNGVYSIGRLNKNDVVALNCEYIPSHGKLTGTEIGAIWKDGADLYVAWKDGSTYGIDIIDQTVKAVARYESLENDAKRMDLEKVVNAVKMLAKDPLPTGTTVLVQVKATRDTDWVDLDSEDGEVTMIEGDQKRDFNAENMGEVFQIGLTLTPHLNTTPEIAAIFATLTFDNEK